MSLITLFTPDTDFAICIVFEKSSASTTIPEEASDATETSNISDDLETTCSSWHRRAEL